jgi:hypothetical protein
MKKLFVIGLVFGFCQVSYAYTNTHLFALASVCNDGTSTCDTLPDMQDYPYLCKYSHIATCMTTYNLADSKFVINTGDCVCHTYPDAGNIYAVNGLDTSVTYNVAKYWLQRMTTLLDGYGDDVGIKTYSASVSQTLVNNESNFDAKDHYGHVNPAQGSKEFGLRGWAGIQFTDPNAILGCAAGLYHGSHQINWQANNTMNYGVGFNTVHWGLNDYASCAMWGLAGTGTDIIDPAGAGRTEFVGDATEAKRLIPLMVINDPTSLANIRSKYSIPRSFPNTSTIYKYLSGGGVGFPTLQVIKSGGSWVKGEERVPPSVLSVAGGMPLICPPGGCP